MESERVDKILYAHGMKEANLVSILLDIQAEANFLPREILPYVAKKIGIPLSRIYHLATFYAAFSLKPRGKYVIKVCLGTACHVKGGPKILHEFERKLNIPAGSTTADKQFTLETVACLGCCAIGPVVVADDNYYSQTTIKTVHSILKKYRKNK